MVQKTVKKKKNEKRDSEERAVVVRHDDARALRVRLRGVEGPGTVRGRRRQDVVPGHAVRPVQTGPSAVEFRPG